MTGKKENRQQKKESNQLSLFDPGMNSTTSLESQDKSKKSINSELTVPPVSDSYGKVGKSENSHVTDKNYDSSAEVYSVTSLLNAVNLDLDEKFKTIFVEGEIGGIGQRKNVYYFSLKDENSLIECVLFLWKTKVDFPLEEGLKVRLKGYLNIYTARGKLSFNVQKIEPVGTGSLNAAFERLKKKLAAEGLFDEKHKKKIPKFPECVGIITSPQGAAFRDIVKVASRRMGTKIILSGAQVQGRTAPQDIIDAFKRLQKLPVEVIICGRGGGSAEDLSCFNDEQLVREVFASEIPIVSAVGHETDFTLMDFVADKRAATPTEAAEIVFPDKREISRNLKQYESRITTVVSWIMESGQGKLSRLMLKLGTPEHLLDTKAQLLDSMEIRMERAARMLLRNRMEKLDHLSRKFNAFDIREVLNDCKIRHESLTSSLNSVINSKITESRENLSLLDTKLNALDPMKVLNRGYAVVRKPDGEILRDSVDVSKGDLIKITLSNGQLNASVE
ncbi:MAG: exodeoxyribonuclease VII large subunit [Deltaproteobacteria bacterium]|nr:exodeoxyribonuclease VII large subunit [Deltaproteobacteria bacterium]